MATITKLVPRRYKACKHDLPGPITCWFRNIGRGSRATCGKCQKAFVLDHPCWDWEGNVLVWKDF